ncbi:unnamed protein product [Cuscuta campestris]|uniref:Pectinesterase inhibitor domain-containing protein n=1 Tax=Cuscuta campestris TaxID=132261 RepID=A0A484LR50_9ASTE|nr:unnamed protein product [Cuscuta campestris]
MFLFTICLCIPANVKAADLISTICSETPNQKFCSDFLKPFNTPGTTLLGLAQKTVESSVTYVRLVYDEVHVREIDTMLKNHELHNSFNKCGVAYTKAVNDLIDIGTVLKSGGGGYRTVQSLVVNAVQEIDTCDKLFTPPNGEPFDFKELAGKARYVCGIVLALANHLIAGKF